MMNRLKDIREDTNTSQDSLAKLIGLNRSAISRYETEESDIPPKYLVIICDYFKISVDYLLYFTDDKKPHSFVNNNSFNNRLKELRKSKNITQIELSKKLNIIQSGYSKYEIGKNDIPTNILKKLSDYYNVSIDYILCRTENKSKYSNSIFKNDKETES